MSPDDRDYEGEAVEAFLRYLRGRGPRPEIESLPEDERTKLTRLFELMEAVVDSDEVQIPPIEEDPVAIRLGLVDGNGPTGGPGGGEPRRGERTGALDPISEALDDLALELKGDLHLASDVDGTPVTHNGNGLLPARAVCRTLGDTLLLCIMQQDDFSDVPRKVAHVFTERPMTTAVAVVSTASYNAVVLTEADCVRAIDPVVGWVDPHLPRLPEPLRLALKRYLEASLPRWDEIARLDDTLEFGRPEEDIAGAVSEAFDHNFGRTLRTAAKKTAVKLLRNVPQASLSAAVNDVRLRMLAGDDLINHIRDIARADSP